MSFYHYFDFRLSGLKEEKANGFVRYWGYHRIAKTFGEFDGVDVVSDNSSSNAG